MLSIYDEATAIAALRQPLDPTLRTIITDRLADAAKIGLADQTHIVVVQAGDSEDAITGELGWSLLVNPMTEVRYGDPAFEPYWSWLQDLGGWHELVVTVGNSGFAYLILVEQADTTLSAMCSEWTAKCR